ncbi:AAA family ATPase [Halobellus inordinatus]|uniref:AAA family ATPase n=1 Tax=Halobellus inordinatus TaxID=1126236 RepID=UPI0021151A93|nr:MoxR family ATPase [Halobellus ramosii]
MSTPAEIYDSIQDEVETVLIGNEEVIEGLTIALLTRGHVLLEGVPGVAKTTIANVFARATGLDYTRVQMTPDILPADVTGTEVYRQENGEFELQRGPIFSNLVVADEINRATPKTQSALLEAMQERQVTIAGQTLSLPTPFVVVATQNPIEMEGTYELPEAQKDRFMLKYELELLPTELEKDVLDRFDSTPDLGPEDVEQVVTTDEIIAGRETVEEVHVSDVVKNYLLAIVTATRDASEIEYGASTRGSLAMLNASKARAAIQGRDYVTPEDVRALAVMVLQHRLVLTTEAEMSERPVADILEDLIEQVPVPEAEPAELTVSD